MRAKVTWLILTAVTAIVVVGVVDAVRGSSSSNPEAAHAAEPVSKSSTTTALQTATEPVATTEPLASTEPVDTTVTATASATPKRLPSCATDQLGLTFTVSDGLAGVVLRPVKGQPCHHGLAPIGFRVRDQSGNAVAVFGRKMATRPADFSSGFEQLLEIPQMSCDPEGSFFAVATVGPYVARRTLPGAELPCNHG